MIVPNDSQRGPYNVVMDVGPALAFRWLDGNTHNRPASQQHVERLARDMKAGRWRSGQHVAGHTAIHDCRFVCSS